MKHEIEYPSDIIDYEVSLNGKKLSIKIPRNEVFRIEEIFGENEYYVPGMENLKAPIVVDVGANVGVFSLYMKQMIPSALLYCYEPAPNALSLFHQNVLPFKDVVVHECGLSNTSGKAHIQLNASNTGQSSLVKGSHKLLGEVEIELRAGVSIFSDNALDEIDILKIDTEGSEVAILQSLSTEGKLQHIKFIVLEYHSESDRREIDQLLSGFSVFGLSSHSLNLGQVKYIRNDLIGEPISEAIPVTTL